MRVLGIDLGSRVVGFGLVSSEKDDVRYLCLKIPQKMNVGDRIFLAFEELLRIVDSWKPTEIAVEEPFYSVNAKSYKVLSQMEGGFAVVAGLRRIGFYEYPPRTVKQAVCGYGGASKEQVKFIIEKTLNLDLNAEPYDISDALSVALAHFYLKGALL